MNINSISSASQSPSFGDIKLGKGGAERLAKTLPLPEAKRLIRNNIFNKCDILITEKTAEIIPEEKDAVLNITKLIANGNGFSDIEVIEHGKRHVFKLEPGLSESEINQYGTENRSIALAEGIAKFIKSNYNWRSFMRSGEAEKAGEPLSANLQSAADEIKRFCNEICMF